MSLVRHAGRLSPQERDALGNGTVGERSPPFHRLRHKNVVTNDATEAVPYHGHLLRRVVGDNMRKKQEKENQKKQPDHAPRN